MRPLVAVRHAAPFDARVLVRVPLLWPLARAAQPFADHDDFPPVETLSGVFEGAPPIRFVQAVPRKRRARRSEGVDIAALYDARITNEGVVPTRARCWHDFMNALVWGTFPLAKRALHARQHRAVAARLAPGDRALPPTRTRELDALAILDEGGVVVLAREPCALRDALKGGLRGRLQADIASGAADAIVFGHAISESLALGVAPAIVAAILHAREKRGDGDLVRAADRALVRAIDDPERLRTPDELARLDLRELSR